MNAEEHLKSEHKTVRWMPKATIIYRIIQKNYKRPIERYQLLNEIFHDGDIELLVSIKPV